MLGEVAPKEKLNSSDPVDCWLIVVSPKMEQPFSAGDMLVPKNPAPFLLSPDTGGPKRFVVFPTKWNSPPVPVKKAAKDSSQQHPRLLLNLTARRVIQWLVAGWDLLWSSKLNNYDSKVQNVLFQKISILLPWDGFWFEPPITCSLGLFQVVMIWADTFTQHKLIFSRKNISLFCLLIIREEI